MMFSVCMYVYPPVCVSVCIPLELPLRSSENHIDIDDFKGFLKNLVLKIANDSKIGKNVEQSN